MSEQFDSAVDSNSGGDSQRRLDPIAVADRNHRNRILRTSAFAATLFVILLVPFYVFACSPISSPGKIGGGPLIQIPPGVPATPTLSRDDRVKNAGPETPIKDNSPTTRETAVALPTTQAGDSRYAFLLLGYGGSGHDGAYLTDSIMVAIVDPSRKSLTLLSLPRDSWVPLSFNGRSSVYQKINTAYAFAEDPTLYPDRLSKYTGTNGPGTFVSDTVSNLLGIPVSYYFALDFQGFRDMINAVGGIDVVVPIGFVARYPANDDPTIDPSWKTVTFASGSQHMSGERAIEYARARETIDDSGEGTDFARSRRQRLILESFKGRLFQPGGFTHLPQLMGIASKHVDTNYTIPAVGGLSQLALDWKSVKIYQTALTPDNYLEQGTGPEGTYILVPGTSSHSWAQTRAFARRLWQDPASGVALASTQVIVENDTGIYGLATRIGADLARLGYNVGTPRDGSPRDTTRLLDRTGGTAKPIESQIGKDLKLGALDVIADDKSTGELIVQLGTDAVDVHLTVPDDALAPSSSVGVQAFGTWGYTPATSTPNALISGTGSVDAPTYPTATSTVMTERLTSIPATSTPRPLPRATPIPVGNDANSVLVPNLVGLLEADAQKVIGDSDLMTTYVNYQTANDVADKTFFGSVPPGAVLSQHPSPGTRVPRGTRISLAVRKS